MIDILHILAAATDYKINAGDVGVPVAGSNAVVGNVLRLIYYFAAIIAVIVIIIGGIFYSISDGDASRVKKAKDAILYAVVGLIVVLFAFVITGLVIGRFA